MTETERDLLDDDQLDELDEDTQKDKYLTFRLAQEDYGLELRHVTEIVVIQKITEVPDLPAFVKGVINLRGQVIPVLDVRARFHLPERLYDERTCVVVVNIGDTAVGLIVDTVNEVLTIPAANLCPPPKLAKGRSARFIQSLGKVGDDVKILLDVNKLLFDEELAQLEALENQPAEPAAG